MLKPSVIFKVMPNTPSLIQEGFSGLFNSIFTKLKFYCKFYLA